MLIWHLMMPLSYFAVFGAYFCSLPDADSAVAAIIVAAREAIYVVNTLVALRVNPSFLLLELDSVVRPVEVGEGSCSWWRRVDGVALRRWTLYLLAPHHYVSLCLMRSALQDSCQSRQLPLHVPKVVFGIVFGGFGDFFSVVALIKLLGQPSFPVALAIGYWLTTTGWVAGVGHAAFWVLDWILGGDSIPVPLWDGYGMMGCCERVQLCLCVVLLALLCILLFGSLFLLGLSVLVLTPLQLSGAVGGLACPDSSILEPWSWVC